MVALGREAGRQVVCELTDMDQPLGHAVGNALEIREAVDTLRGEGPSDLRELVLSATGHLLALSDLGVDAAEGRRLGEEAIASGAALRSYEAWVRAQGGDPSLDALPQAAVVRDVPAPESGYVAGIATTALGIASLHLGAGRTAKDDAIDHSVGVLALAKRGDAVQAGDPLATVHARTDTDAEQAVADILACYRLAAEPPPVRPIVLDVVG
jgi:pyrimidine-nucleoside phosphorylase